jgi:sortase A
MKRKGSIYIVLGCILIVISAGLFAYNCWVSSRAGQKSKAIVEELENKHPSDTIPDYKLNPDMEMPTITIDGHKYIGTLEIPSLNLKLPIMSEWSYPNLKIAPCRYYGSAYKSNMIIAAHNYNTHFGRLSKLNIGDTVKFIDADKNEFLYSVADLEILQPTDCKAMKDSQWDLTLFTCTIGGRTRVTVRCEEQ